MPSLRIIAAGALAAPLTATTAPAALATRYAAPTGTSLDPCTLAQPCDLATAIGGTTPADRSVRLLGGDYPPLSATVATVTSATDIAAEPGTGRPVIHIPAGTQLRVVNGSRLADVDVLAAAGTVEPVFAADTGTLVERVRLTGDSSGAVLKTGSTGTPATVRDVLVVNTGSTSSIRGIAVECNGCSSTARVINATVITKDGQALAAIAAGAAGTQTTTLEAYNTIALSATAADAFATGAGDHAVVTLDHVAYGDSAANPNGTVTDLGGSVGDAPLFADAAGGDYSPAPGSPVINAGADPGTPALSATDLLGRPRVLGAAVDIGASEAPAAPVATTGDAGAVTTTGATVAGTVDPGGLAASWRVEYGTTAAYGATAPGSPDTSGGFTAEAVTATLGGLAPGTTYHYRVVAEHAFGTSAGADRTFTTAAPSPPSGTPSAGGEAAVATPPDRTAPVISRVSLAPRRILRSRLRAPTLRFTLSEAASVTVTLERLLPGRRSGTRCVAARRAATGRGCTRAVRISRLTRRAPAGAAKLAISLRRGRAALPAGGYRVTVTAKDAAGNAAGARRVALTLR